MFSFVPQPKRTVDFAQARRVRYRAAFPWWGKPVPVNPYNFKNPRRDKVLVSFAGPASNFISALLFGVVFYTGICLWLDDRGYLVPGRYTAPGAPGFASKGSRVFFFAHPLGYDGYYVPVKGSYRWLRCVAPCQVDIFIDKACRYG